MDKCRICLVQCRPKRLYPIFSSEGNVTYSEMLCAISNVQVQKGDGFPNKICLSCSTKIKEAYDIKHLAEKSDITLRNGKYGPKRIHFSNINDIKIEIDIKQVKVEKDHHESIDIELDFNNKENVFYNDTIIKKVVGNALTSAEQVDKKPLSVAEFLHNFKEDDDDMFDDVQVYDSDVSPNEVDDLPIAEVFKRNKKKYKKKKHKKWKVDPDDDSDYYPDHKDKDDDDDFIPAGQKKKVKKIIENNEKPKGRKGRPTKIARIMIPVLIKPDFLPDIKVLPQRQKAKQKQKRVKPICPYCGLADASRYHLQRHTATKDFKCVLCPKTFLTSGGLKSHEASHSGERKFHCEQCTASFYTKGALHNHFAMHKDIKKYPCYVCGKAFKRKCAMRRHARAHSSANKNVKCELCNMSFFCASGLRHHMRVHTGERPFNCELCSQPYSYKHDFNRHCIKKHGVYLKRRQVYVMNAEVLARERELMKELALKAHGIIREGEKLNPFEDEGAQGALAFKQVITAIQTNQFNVDLGIPDPVQFSVYASN